MNAMVGWILIVIASVIPGVAALLFGWDRTTLSKQYFWLGIAAVLLWSAAASWRRRTE